ncbi:hypothetical protein GCM10009836_21910 [Pseudonocardia ailaonensis]|uniref:L,D-TPase catalytic domain-containing protein n=1 Tax=Pseudonocardia ailaonensis TaxID=367279 RepID=A0ABN2MXC9_9PSEU
MAAAVAVVAALIGGGVAVAATRGAAPVVVAPAAQPAIVPAAAGTRAVPALTGVNPVLAGLGGSVAVAARAAQNAPVTGTPCRRTARACIDLSANQAWLIRGGVVEYGPVPITHGRPGHLTPPGTFRVTFKDIDHLSREFDLAPMPYSVFFNGGIAFHQGSLSVLSHGCIHLSTAAARTFFAGLSPGDVVQVAP